MSVNAQPRQQPAITARTDDLVDGQDGAAHMLSLSQMGQKLTSREGWFGSYGSCRASRSPRKRADARDPDVPRS